MELIISTEVLTKKFCQLLDSYEEYHFATAWAGMPEKVIEKIESNKTRIAKMVVGIHFYQTHPSFLEKFRDENLRVIMQPNGTFHPKVFLFYNSDNDWSILIGSANLTTGGFNDNTEGVFFLKGNTKLSDIKKNALKLISDGWQAGKRLNDTELKKYRERWDVLKRKRKDLSERFGFRNEKVQLGSDIMLLNWSEYVKEYTAVQRERMLQRFFMLNETNKLFERQKSLDDMTSEQRLFLGGVSNKVFPQYPDLHRNFGTNGNGRFRRSMKIGSKPYSKALKQIPLIGEVTEKHFNNFKSEFLNEPNSKATWISSASRLLIMKRPDVFYSPTSANTTEFQKAFNLEQEQLNLDNYWELVIERIQLCTWWQNPTPKNDYEKKLMATRSAMLDVLYY